MRVLFQPSDLDALDGTLRLISDGGDLNMRLVGSVVVPQLKVPDNLSTNFGVVRVGQPMTQGHNVLTRTRNLDGIPFSKSLDFNFELISWQPTTLTFAMTSYWYAFAGATTSQ